MNAVKYAFPADRKSRIDVRVLAEEDGRAMLSIRDDGVGPACWKAREATRVPDDSRHGTGFVQAIANEIGGTITRSRPEGGGHEVTLRWRIR